MACADDEVRALPGEEQDSRGASGDLRFPPSGHTSRSRGQPAGRAGKARQE